MRGNLTVEEHFVANGDGWSLHLKCTHDPDAHRPELRPLVIVPGYGMNGFIFGFHPRGMSLERFMAEAGFEVWTVNLRRQGPSRRERKDAGGPSLRAYAETDLMTATVGALARSRSTADRVDLLGASLGGSIAYAHLALCADHRVGALVSVGAPLRWVEIHPVLKTAFRSTTVASMLRFSGTRRLAQVALPLLANRVPKLLSLYLNPSQVDLSAAKTLAQTVDDPHPRVNADISRWIKHGDLVLGGTNVTDALDTIDLPLLLVTANRDGIVPLPAALSARDAWGGDDVETLHIGDDDDWYAHANLFIGDRAPQAVFAPIAAWLAERNR